MRKIVLLLVCMFVVVHVNADNGMCKDRHCIAVVDAGSTGSRLHIYAYDTDSNHTPIQIKELWSKKIKPGIASIEAKPDVINNYLNDLFINVPESNMPVYFYATAGMRLLPHPKQEAHFKAIRRWFAAQQQWQLVNAKTITGEEEGLLGWLAVNYQLGTLHANAPDAPLVAVMDMGGASVQVVLPLESNEQEDNKNRLSVDIYGQHIVLFVHSFLGLGQTLLSEQFLNTASCFPNGYLLPSGLVGKGEARACEHEITKLVNKVHAVNRIIQPIVLKNPSKSWYVIGGLGSMVQDKPFTFDGNKFTGQALMEQADIEVCHRQWQDLYSQYPTNDFLYGYCMFPAYYYALMVDGYGLKPEQPINYMPAEKQGSDWSLGVVLHQQ